MSDDIIQRMSSALSRIDLDGIASSVSRAAQSAARQLGLFPRQQSPYIVGGSSLARRATTHAVEGAFSLSLAFVLFGGAFVAGALMHATIGASVLGALCAGSVVLGTWLLSKSKHDRLLKGVIARMSDELGGRESVPLSELARLVEMPAKELAPYVQDAIALGMIPEGRLAGQGPRRTLFLTDRAWKDDYRKQMAAEHAAQSAAAQEASLPADAVELIDACDAFVRLASETAPRIVDGQARLSVGRIAGRVEELAAFVRRHPDAAPQLRKLTTYYLPTTAKLTLSFVELEDQGDDPQAAATRKELKETFALMESALGKLSDEAEREQTWDIRSDMDVMRTMLDQDGLA